MIKIRDMTNWDIINIVQSVLNKDLNGRAFKISEYQQMINAASLKHFVTKIGLPEEYQRGMAMAQQGTEVSQRIDNDLLPFLRIETFIAENGVLNLAGAGSDDGSGGLDYGIRCNTETLTGSYTYVVTFLTPMGTTDYDIDNGIKVFDEDGFDIGYESVVKATTGFTITVSTNNQITLHYQAVKYQ